MSSNQTKVISVQDIVWRREGKHILDHVSWDVFAGEHWAILGLNGSGKTSLLKIITGYEWPTSGQVNVLGERYGATNIQELRKSIGWVSSALDQRYQYMTDAVEKVVLSGKFASVRLYDEVTAEDKEKAFELMEHFHIRYLEGRPFHQLSQGEKKKTMLARAWMADPKLLILDEPCSGLDIYSREELLTSIQKLCARADGPTLIYVTHHVEEVIPAFTHALMIKNGQVVAAGAKQEMLTESFLQQTFRVPINVRWESNRPWISV